MREKDTNGTGKKLLFLFPRKADSRSTWEGKANEECAMGTLCGKEGAK